MKISIIVPIYNTEQYLRRCISSILSQGFLDFELLLIDDGSTDGSGAICDDYSEKDSRVRVFHKGNGGVSSARNLGLEKACGEWICFVDSDDELMPEGLQVMVDGISDEVSMVMAGYYVYDDSGSLSYAIQANESYIIDREWAAREMYAPADYRYYGFIWGKLLRFNEVKQNKIRFSEDVFFNEDRLFLTQFICAMNKSAYYTTEPVYRYFEHLDSAMRSLEKEFNPKFVTDMKASIKMRKMVRERYENDELRSLADFEVYRSYRRIVGMMKEFNYDGASLKSELRRKLVDAVGIRTYASYEMGRVKRRVRNKLKKCREHEKAFNFSNP